MIFNLFSIAPFLLSSQVTFFAIGLVFILVTYSRLMKKSPRKEELARRACFMSLCSFATMLHKMIMRGKHLKIFNPIIKFVSIDMMNMLFRCQLSIKVFFHNYSVFKHNFTVNPKRFISILSKESIPICPSFQPSVAVQSYPIVMKTTKTKSSVWATTPINSASASHSDFISNSVPPHPTGVFIAHFISTHFLPAKWNNTDFHGSIMSSHLIMSTLISPI